MGLNQPFPVVPKLVAIARAFKNPSFVYIADGIFPRTPTDGEKEFRWLDYDLASGYDLPDTAVGRRGAPNEVSYKATEQTDFTVDQGLDDPIPQDDIDVGAKQGYDQVGKAVERLTDVILRKREVRVANLAFNAANYPTDYKTQLSGTTQWSDYTAGHSDPIANIVNGMSAAVMPLNVMAIGKAAWVKLSMHPRICAAVHGNSGDVGIVTRQQVANLFGLEEVLVGEARINTAKKGQTAVLSMAWGKHCLLYYRDKAADLKGGVTYGFTAERGKRQAGAQPDGQISVRGGQRVRVWESVKELIVAPECAYFIQDAVL